MKPLIIHPRLTLINRPSLREQRLLMAAPHRRPGDLPAINHVKALARIAKQSLVIAVCAAGLFAGAARGQAAGTPAVSAPALFNEGNAHQRAGRLGPAILNYERASLIAPRDPMIAQNLRSARQKAGVSAPAVPAWQRPLQAFSLDGLAMLASISLVLFTLLVFGILFSPATVRGVARAVAVTLGAAALVAVSAIVLRWPELDRAVIQGTRAIAHIAPAAASGTAFELKPGDLVNARREHGDFVLIRTPDRRSGWVARTDVERIIPPATRPSPM